MNASQARDLEQTIAGNLVEILERDDGARFGTERELNYSPTFPANATPPPMARQIRRDISPPNGILRATRL